MKSEYQSLLEQGYTEEQIKVILDNQTKIHVFDSPMQPKREDKGVEILTPAMTKRTSNIMMGYNKDKIDLGNGNYLLLSEMVQAIKQSLQESGPNKKIACKRTGKVVSPSELLSDISDIVKQDSVIRLDGPSDKIVNQSSQKLSIKGEGKKEFIRKGIMMLGRNGIKLPNGEYVQLE